MTPESPTGFRQADDPAVLMLRGDDAGEFLNGQVSNDVSSLADGESRYALLLTPKGRLRADMRIARDGDETIVVASTDHLPTIRHTIDTFRIGYFFSTEDATGEFALIELVGPGSAETLEALPVPVVVLDSALGADALVEHSDAAAVVSHLQSNGIPEMSAEQLASARVSAGVPSFGYELDEDTFPAEAGLEGRAVNFEKGCYVGQETVARMHYKGKPNRHLRLLRADSPLVSGTIVTGEDSRELGKIGTVAPGENGGSLALAILRREGEPGSEVDAGGVAATIIELPVA